MNWKNHWQCVQESAHGNLVESTSKPILCPLTLFWPFQWAAVGRAAIAHIFHRLPPLYHPFPPEAIRLDGQHQVSPDILWMDFPIHNCACWIGDWVFQYIRRNQLFDSVPQGVGVNCFFFDNQRCSFSRDCFAALFSSLPILPCLSVGSLENQIQRKSSNRTKTGSSETKGIKFISFFRVNTACCPIKNTNHDTTSLENNCQWRAMIEYWVCLHWKKKRSKRKKKTKKLSTVRKGVSCCHNHSSVRAQCCLLPDYLIETSKFLVTFKESSLFAKVGCSECCIHTNCNEKAKKSEKKVG